MAAIQNYSPDQLSLSIGGRTIRGAGDEDFVVFRSATPLAEYVHTVDGMPLRSQSAVRSFEMDVTVSQACPGWRDMWELVVEQQDDATAEFAVRFVDPISGDVVAGAGQFLDSGEAAYARTAGTRTFKMLVANAALSPSTFGSLITG